MTIESINIGYNPTFGGYNPDWLYRQPVYPSHYVQPYNPFPQHSHDHTHCPHCGEAIYHKATPYWSGPTWIVTTNTTIDWNRTNEADSGNIGNLTFSSSEVVR